MRSRYHAFYATSGSTDLSVTAAREVNSKVFAKTHEPQFPSFERLCRHFYRSEPVRNLLRRLWRRSVISKRTRWHEFYWRNDEPLHRYLGTVSSLEFEFTYYANT